MDVISTIASIATLIEFIGLSIHKWTEYKDSKDVLAKIPGHVSSLTAEWGVLKSLERLVNENRNLLSEHQLASIHVVLSATYTEIFQVSSFCIQHADAKDKRTARVKWVFWDNRILEKLSSQLQHSEIKLNSLINMIHLSVTFL